MKEFRHDPINPNITSGENYSFWTASSKPIAYQKLKKSIETDVLIIGGGISGLSTAYCLSLTGRDVTLIDDGYLGSGETGRTTAHITYALDDRYFELERIFGKRKAMLAANSHMTALQWIDNTIRLEKIQCGFKRIPGYLFLHNTDKIETLEKEYESTRRLGLFTEVLPKVPGIENLTESRCIKFPGQGQFHPLLYLSGLADAITKKRSKIYTETKAEEITKKGARANGYSIKANHIVVATNTPVNDLVTMHTKQWPYRTYVIGAKILKGALSYSLWWDTGNIRSKWVTEPYHYVRLQEFDDLYDLLIVGGEDHKVGQADKEDIPETNRYESLWEWTRKKFPAVESIEYKWSGQVMEPIDSLGFIGKNPGDDNIYIITGDSGNGMTHGTIGGILVADIINGKRNLWEELYSPSRITWNTAGDFLREAGNMVAQYADWIAGSDIKEL
ncbi:MAG TPA: FAD-dependent oxidoreductase, partial [Bacteroidales bacterium]|nr:FAD-dependent oxidoreductase [Bacteroidales bacterium]